MTKTLRSIVIALATAVPGFVSAQSSGLTPAQLNWANDERNFQRLGLSPEQAARMKEMGKRFGEQMEEAASIKDRELRATSLETIAAKQKEAIQALFTPAQLDTLKTLKAEMERLGRDTSLPDKSMKHNE